MNELTIFKYEENEVRTVIGEDGEPWWFAKDVCDILGLVNPSQVVSALKDSQKDIIHLTEGASTGNLQRNIVNEAGLYKLIMRSRKPDAEKFQDWIAEEVLPTIRKTGSYSIQEALPQTYAEALRALADKSESEEKLLIEQKKNKPKVDYFNDVSDAKNEHGFNVAAKLLGWGRNTLMERLRIDKILMDNNVPYQRYVDIGRFKVKERTFMAGSVKRITSTTFVTGKGMQWLQGKYSRQPKLF